ncbi:MAG TPA: ACT domain-containing protein [Gemmatimonadota bacterium]|nr:ACT domain-containing protein [Gemmatimonadota bacterium]
MPIAQQISVFVENRPGRLGALCEVLAEGGINIQAIMVPSGTDYGIVHVIVDRHEDALQSLEERGYRTYTSRVLDVTLDDHPGALAQLADHLAENGIDIKYAYSAVGEQGRLILSVNDAERASELLDS